MFITRWAKSAAKKIRAVTSSAGPGFITGAADDDPSGVATYSIAGASFGYGLSWLALLSLPMMIAVQEACARIGIITGQGLAGVIRRHYSQPFLYIAVLLLGVANIVNIGADLGAMADVIAIVVGFPWWFWLVTVTVLSVAIEILVPYRRYERLLKFLGLFLLAYVVTAVIVSPSIPKLIGSILLPHLEFSLPYLAAAVGFLGTTISPYLFFWQASEEVEEEIARRKISGFGMGRPKFTMGDLQRMRLDVNFGMLFSQVVTLAIIVTAAETLHKAGVTSIGSAQEAALALRPLAGNFAFILFALGIIGIGFQAIPVLAGSLAYAVAEVFREPEGLGKPFPKAKFFYLVIVAASLLGAVINIVGVNPIQALYYAAIVNGIIAVPLVAVVTFIASDKAIMGKETSGSLSRFFSSLTVLVMGAAAVVMIYLALRGN